MCVVKVRPSWPNQIRSVNELYIGKKIVIHNRISSPQNAKIVGIRYAHFKYIRAESLHRIVCTHYYTDCGLKKYTEGWNETNYLTHGKEDDMDTIKLEGDIKVTADCIEYWDDICDAKVECNGTDGCPLCTVYYNNPDTIGCAGCPINIKESQSQCHGTPFYDFKNYVTASEWYEVANTLMVHDYTSKEYAEAMRDYLRELLCKLEAQRATFKVGDYFKYGSSIYILADTVSGNIVALINIKTGGRWTEPVTVENNMKIDSNTFYTYVCNGARLIPVKDVTIREI